MPLGRGAATNAVVARAKSRVALRLGLRSIVIGDHDMNEMLITSEGRTIGTATWTADGWKVRLDRHTHIVRNWDDLKPLVDSGRVCRDASASEAFRRLGERQKENPTQAMAEMLEKAMSYKHASSATQTLPTTDLARLQIATNNADAAVCGLMLLACLGRRIWTTLRL